MNRKFVRKTLERAVKSFAQAMVLAVCGSTIGEIVNNQSLNAFQVDWETAFGFGFGGFILSVLTSVASVPFGPDDDPSLVT